MTKTLDKYDVRELLRSFDMIEHALCIIEEFSGDRRQVLSHAVKQAREYSANSKRMIINVAITGIEVETIPGSADDGNNGSEPATDAQRPSAQDAAGKEGSK